MSTHWTLVLRYTAFQLPSATLFGFALWAAHRWLGLPPWIGWTALALWIVKDALLFPFVRHAYAPGDGRHVRDPRDALGVAPAGLVDEGYVRIGNERWRARRTRGSAPIAPGDAVHVLAVEGLTLRVERAASADPASGPADRPDEPRKAPVDPDLERDDRGVERAEGCTVQR